MSTETPPEYTYTVRMEILRGESPKKKGKGKKLNVDGGTGVGESDKKRGEKKNDFGQFDPKTAHQIISKSSSGNLKEMCTKKNKIGVVNRR